MDRKDAAGRGGRGGGWGVVDEIRDFNSRALTTKEGSGIWAKQALLPPFSIFFSRLSESSLKFGEGGRGEKEGWGGAGAPE